MTRHDEPNASHFSARYAERKRAAERARDEARGPRVCSKCDLLATKGSILCFAHEAQKRALMHRWFAPGGPDALQEWLRTREPAR